MIRRDSFWLRQLSYLLALVFVVLPLPGGLELVRPYLLAMVLCYWLLETPEHAGLGIAFLLGLMVDLVSASLVGENALRLVVLAFLVQRFRPRLRFFPLWQQALAIFILLLNDRIVMAAIHWLAGAPGLPWSAWLSPVIGLALWPWLFVLLDSLRLRSRERGA
jgi:rod shape-determining protein MreD